MTVTPSHAPTLGHLPIGACQPANGTVKRRNFWWVISLKCRRVRFRVPVSSYMPAHQVSVLHYRRVVLWFFPLFHIRFVRVSLVVYYRGRRGLQRNTGGCNICSPSPYYFDNSDLM